MALTTGGSGFPAGWSHASPIFNFCALTEGKPQSEWYFYGGYIWVGQEPATDEDVIAIMPFAKTLEGIDLGTLCGESNPAYRTEGDILKAIDQCYR